jgi:glycosyltransferase involved in cell wall biosynthesis
MTDRISGVTSPGLERCAVLIPAREPESSLGEIVSGLLDAGFGAVLVLDDGSSPHCRRLFESLRPLPRVHLLRHAVNLGKGRALKTGINAFLTGFPGFDRLVTADADGQHTVADIVRVAQAGSSQVALGVRVFSGEVPLRSRFGNLLTRQVFALVTGVKLTDTQTGLRCFPVSTLPALLLLEGERYEYEMTVLAHLCQSGRRPLEVPIETVYLDGNKSSHFDPIRDSMRIYFVLARFYLSSLIAAGIDFAGFTAAYSITHHVLTGVIVGRLSSLVNFALNKKFVFQSHGELSSALWRYYLLVFAIGGLSYGSIFALHRFLHWNVFAAKLTVDVLLSLISFSMQRTFVFRNLPEA